ncbi:hypothetical protein EJ02DRAFT_445658 [Clathrospora elynae]|uniref:Tautomerase cis-CaaD-like domain-containing protein n=1 Tax=Clathrospora elynae TaxID=706981 RepID=A0A6A5SKQ5_9PLEO|nr:hypothetical protein EJ02DRAFT_445658 [Clathrospora elynae]
MPLWMIYHPPSAFVEEDTKCAFAKAITEIYSVKLPAFYVNVIFQPIQQTSFYVGGVARPSPHTDTNKPGPDSKKPFIRITIQNIARKIPNDARRDGFLERVDNALKPFIEDAGYDWEYSVAETSRDLWKMQGLVPPMPDTEAEKVWCRVNEAVPFKRETGGLV